MHATCGSIPIEDANLDGNVASVGTWVSYINSVVGHEEEITAGRERRDIWVVTGMDASSDVSDSWEHVRSPPRFDEFTREALHMKTPRRIELHQPPIGDTTPIATDGT